MGCLHTLKVIPHKKVLQVMSDENKTVKYKSVQILMSPEDHAKFKTLCYLRGVKMTEISIQPINQWIEQEIAKNPWLRMH